MIFSRILSFLLRAIEFISAIVVMGITAYHIHLIRDQTDHPFDFPKYGSTQIFPLVVGVIGSLVALLLLIPRTASFHWPIDIIFSLLWFAVFGVLVHYVDTDNCGRRFRVWRDGCSRNRTNKAFSFIAAVAWFVSFLLSLWVARKSKNNVAVAQTRR